MDFAPQSGLKRGIETSAEILPNEPVITVLNASVCTASVRELLHVRHRGAPCPTGR